MLPSAETESDGHNEQVSFPESGLYVPAPHCEQLSPFAPVHPALHSHAVIMMLPTGETESDGQEEHVASVKSDLYLPSSHCEQFSPPMPDQPALHVQLSYAILPAGDVEFGGHVDVLQLNVPNISWYLPCAHCVHINWRDVSVIFKISLV